MRVRLFIQSPLELGHEVELPSAAARHAVQVLRLRVGDAVTLFNGDGQEYPGRLAAATPRNARVAIESRIAATTESPLHIRLVQAIARGEKMDWIIQKATELGVVRITPVATVRNGIKLDAARAATRVEHWRAVAIAACAQCGRNVLPVIDAPTGLAAALAAEAQATEATTRWTLWLGGATRLREACPATSSVTVAVGPEGGFAAEDRSLLLAHGFRPLSLGPRTLRTETAGIAALAALQALYGDG